MRSPRAAPGRRAGGAGEETEAAVAARLHAQLRSSAPLGALESALVLGVVCLYVTLPGHPPIDAAPFAALLLSTAAGTAALAVAVERLRADDQATTALLVLWGIGDIAAISAGIALTGGGRSDLYLLYLVLAVFHGANGFSRRSRLAFHALTVAAYLVTLAALGWHIGTATAILRIGLLVLLAWGVDVLMSRLVQALRHQVRQSDESQRRARLWRKTADLIGSLDPIDADAVWRWAVESVAELGYDTAAVHVPVDGGLGHRLAHAVGVRDPGPQPTAERVGMAGLVFETGRTEVVDYANFSRAAPQMAAEGIRTVIGTPVRGPDGVVGVLVVGTRRLRQPSEEEVAALELVAAQAGRTLRRAHRYDSQRRDADRVRTILAAAPDAMLVYGPDLTVVQANLQAARLFRADVPALVGLPVTALLGEDADTPGPGDRPGAGAAPANGGGPGTTTPSAGDGTGAPPAVLLGSAPTTTAGSGVLRGARRDGSAFPAEVSVAPVDTAEGRLMAATVRDVSERLAYERQLAHNATHDDLTGLPNRTQFLGRLTEVLDDSASPRVAVCFLDVDHFKYVNDSRGHGVGDELVLQIARRLAHRAGAELVARFGGDEFALLCTVAVDRDEAVGWAWRWLAAFDEPFLLDGVETHVSASAGVAFGAPGDTALDVIRRADAAMYRAKQRGRGRVELFDDVLTARAAWRLDITSALHDAVERGELSLQYQPVVAIDTAEVVGLEALLRWSRPTGSVPPAEFVPVAEDSGLIVPIGRWVLNEACRQAAAWFAEAADGPELTISVNVSSRQLDHDHLIGDVADVLHRTGLPPSCLVLEITESSFIEDLPAVVRRIDSLRRLGVQVAIDDFGTGFSSLSSLSRLPIDAVKIDKSFVDGLGTRYDTVTQAVVDVARTFDLRVVAEGVERAAQAATLQVLGCRLAQGFLYARPLPADEAELAVKRRRCPTTH